MFRVRCRCRCRCSEQNAGAVACACAGEGALCSVQNEDAVPVHCAVCRMQMQDAVAATTREEARDRDFRKRQRLLKEK